MLKSLLGLLNPDLIKSFFGGIVKVFASFFIYNKGKQANEAEANKKDLLNAIDSKKELDDLRDVDRDDLADQLRRSKRTKK